MQNTNKIILEAIQKALINEAAEPKEVKQIPADDIDVMIRKVRDQVNKIKAALVNGGIPKESKPCRMLTTIYQRLGDLDPVSTKMTEYMKPRVDVGNAAKKMVEGDVKVDIDSDDEIQDASAKYATANNMDTKFYDEDKM